MAAEPGQAEARYKILVRAMILGCLGAAFILIDGLVLFATGGLSSDAGPLFPWLGGAFANKNRSSGTGLLVIGVMLLVVLAIGWFTYGRKMRAAYLAEMQGGATLDAGDTAPGADQVVVNPTVRIDRSGRGS